ncbi:FUSC family protein [Burkholderia sp. Ac-20365]|uniref:FUSC family protein n=1 Tax=Burkholderia sp. Ac-20365 TaxID=2703897 RepID=UPI00197C142A|nr:FUSC family protein [Burkholderia sp. Ac-20365]MBN3761565.1 FUSC family protein [Burkholderia sp. Ac-20365]
MIATLRGLLKEAVVYRNDDFPRFLHAFKAALAIILSMLICMRLELRAPGTSMVSAVIVMLQQRSGMVIARGFYRMLGIACGSLAGLTLISLFAQQPPLFIAGLSIWVGLFVAGSSYYKNYQSYGFVLSGYAACITTVPEWSVPYDVVTNLIHIVSEVMIGVATGSLVSALVFPQKVVPALIAWRQTALAKLLPALRSAALGNSRDDPIESYMKLIHESVAIEDLRTAAVFEDPEMRLRNDALTTLDRSFLDAVTRLYALDRARQLTQHLDAGLQNEINDMFALLVKVATVEDTDAGQTEKRLTELQARLTSIKESLPDLVALQLGKVSPESADFRVIEMVGAEVYTATSSLRDFCGACSIVLSPPKIQLSLPIVQAIKFMRNAPIRSNGLSALLSGLRATIATGVVGAAWIASGWTNGYIAVVSAGITSGFFSLSPTPVAASWQAFAGCAIACVVGFVVNFMLMPAFGDVSLLALCFGILLFFSSYAATFPRFASMGAGFSIYLCYLLTPMNVAVYDPPYLLDRAFGLLIGIGVAAIAFSLVAPKEGEWLAKQYTRRIGDVLSHASTDVIDVETSAQLGMSMRDLIVRIVTVPGVSQAYREKITKWAFGQLWIANALIHVRALADSEANALPPSWQAAQREWLHAMECVAEKADVGALKTALSQTEHVLDMLRKHADQPAPESRRAIFEMRAGLYSTRAALIDQLQAASGIPAVAS